MIKALDALALVSLPDEVLLQRIAALWCRAFKNRCPYSWDEMAKWVWSEFGPVLDPEQEEKLARKLLDETKRQIRLRARRFDRRQLTDPLTQSEGRSARLGRLLQSRLGPARAWVDSRRILKAHTSECFYIDGATFSGIVAGLIPIAMSLRRILNPTLLVYRQGSHPARSWWVPGHITTVSDAFIWVIPTEAAEFLSLPGTRVEHDGEEQECRLITQFGTKSLPWRELVPST